MSSKPLLKEGVYDPGIFKAIFLAGGPGSGKSYVASNTIEGMGLKIVNIDEFLPMLLKQKNIPLKFNTHTPEQKQAMLAAREKAREYVHKRLDLWLKGRLGLVIDGTGRDYDKLKQTSEKFKELGYDVYMVFVNTSLPIAIERNKMRGEQGDRQLELPVVKKLWYDAQSNIARYMKYFGEDNFTVVNNNGNDKEAFHKTHKKIRNFISKPAQNPIAKDWVEQEKKQHMKINELRQLIKEELQELYKRPEHISFEHYFDNAKEKLTSEATSIIDVDIYPHRIIIKYEFDNRPYSGGTNAVQIFYNNSEEKQQILDMVKNLEF